ncbi:hypothetical protein K5D34_11350 [Pseudomonas cichorii]|nr:hypothetical protein [Pseudomonas cichorii]MBX8510273.1 hypothetical protein [Pseudomonas cichorii]MBX8524057.1 hypothetical protein [Pseudomonas cichorii]MBX8563862.1 hypothetical protein [Pseudomonas cichorii]MBX8600831.1 hypothetical protein [Pseudomonas cichorii]
MDPEEFEVFQDVQKGITTATVGILRFLTTHLVLRTPHDELVRLSKHFSSIRHDKIATEDLGEGGIEAYSQIYDLVESALIEAVEKKTGKS